MSAEEIARGLTKAQRALVMDLPPDGSPVQMFVLKRYTQFGRNALSGFGKSGLISSTYKDPAPQHRLTPLGLEVRAILGDYKATGEE